MSTREIGNCYEIREQAAGNKPSQMRSSVCDPGSYAPWPVRLWRDPYFSRQYEGSGLAFNSDIAPVAFALAPTEQPSSLELHRYAPTVHLVRSISFSIDGAVETSRDVPRSIDGVATAARFANPQGAVSDQRGNLFIVDSLDSVIRRVTPSGEATTFAGAPQQVGRNDGIGRDARFNFPQGISIDAKDNLYIADTGNGLIRKITPAAVVSTLNGVAESGGAAAPSPLHFKRPVAVVPTGDGSLYIIDYEAAVGSPPSAVVKKILPSGIVSAVAGPRTEGEEAP